jgi:hypothetical protein
MQAHLRSFDDPSDGTSIPPAHDGAGSKVIDRLVKRAGFFLGQIFDHHLEVNWFRDPPA